MQNSIKNNLQQLMEKDMDRRDFLVHLGIGFASILGISAVLKTLSHLGSPSKSSTSYGYGSSA